MTSTTGDRIAERSIEVLRQGQAPSGAFIASPNFPTYHYSWLRDGSFCAHAVDLVGDRMAAAAFHAWVVRSIEAHRSLAESVIARIGAGETPPMEEMPPARYTLDGTLESSIEEERWPNFQIDGYGMWLWALEEHLAGAALPGAWQPTVELVAVYLQATWRLKSYSCWEELDDGEHAATLGATFAGLLSASRLLGEPSFAEEAERVRAELLNRFVVDGRFKRGPQDGRLDGSLLWLAVPFGVLPGDDPRITATVEAIKRDLWRPGGGVYRYLGDNYYGGGEWLLLASSLAWQQASAGETESVELLRGWVRGQAQPNGDLPEQVSSHVQLPEMVEPWRQRWGPLASPLLWSHAMYLIVESVVAG
jgi:isomaltose glucohydrolase